MPEIEAPLIVSGELPEEVSVTVLETGEPIATFPKERLVGDQLMVATVGFSVTAKVFATPAEFAVRVTDFLELTAKVVAVNVTCELPEGTVTLGGTETDELLLEMDTTVPLLGATCVRETVQSSVPAPVTELDEQDSALRAVEEPLEAFLPVPLNVTYREPLVLAKPTAIGWLPLPLSVS